MVHYFGCPGLEMVEEKNCLHLVHDSAQGLPQIDVPEVMAVKA